MFELFFLVLSGGAFLGGAFFVGTSVQWRLKSIAVDGEIIGFQKRKGKGRFLPSVKFIDQNGNEIKARIEQTDNLSFLISGAEKQDVIPIRYDEKNAKIVRFDGYINMIVGILFCMPLPYTAIVIYGDAIAQTQAAFMLVLLGILGGGWVLLRLLRFNY